MPFTAPWGRAEYQLSDSKNDVVRWLTQKYPSAVTSGNKAVFIKGNAGRRDADVVIAAEFRRYYTFPVTGQPSYETGISFFTSNGTEIQNFPKQHSDSCTSKEPIIAVV